MAGRHSRRTSSAGRGRAYSGSVRIVSTEQAALGIETGVVGAGRLENTGAEAGCRVGRCCVSSTVRSVRRSTKMKPMVRIAVAGVQQCALSGCISAARSRARQRARQVRGVKKDAWEAKGGSLYYTRSEEHTTHTHTLLNGRTSRPTLTHYY